MKVIKPVFTESVKTIIMEFLNNGKLAGDEHYRCSSNRSEYNNIKIWLNPHIDEDMFNIELSMPLDVDIETVSVDHDKELIEIIFTKDK